MLSTLLFAACLFYTQAHSPSAHGWNRYTLNGHLKSFRTATFDRAANKLYLGGVNTMYELNPQNVSSDPRKLTWKPNPKREKTCRDFKSDDNLCQNNIRVFLPINDTHLYACGTMAFLPTCTHIEKETFTRTKATEIGRWKTPRNPYVSTVSVMANQTLFTATRGSTHGNEAIISRALNGVTLRTKEADKFWLHDPIFIGGYHVTNSEPLQGKVMLFFREKAEEFLPYNFGMASDPNERNIVSRVATVCVNDHGGSAYVLNRRFATYVKKTLVCNAPIFADDETTFRYTHLESTFEMVDDTGRSTIYGIFTMPNDAIAGSAICAFTISDIEEALARNQYWSQSKSLGIARTTYGGNEDSAPGRCVEETRHLSQTRLTFSQNHPTKFGYIFPSQNTPFYQEPGTRFSHIVVDTVSSQRSRLHENVTVLYMMTASGLLKRVVFPTNNPVRNWTLPDIQLVQLKGKESVINMILGDNYLYVVTNMTVVQMPLAACSVYTSCNECVTTNDPYCIPLRNGSCTSSQEMNYGDVEELKATEVICPSAPRDVHPEQQLIEQLRRNVSLLTDRNNLNEERLAQVSEERNRLSIAAATCNIEIGALTSENSLLRNGMMESERALNETKTAYNISVEKAETCERTKNFFMDHALRVAFELRRRPTLKEHEKQIRTISLSRDSAIRALRQCRDEKYTVIRKASACSASMKLASDKIVAINTTCYKQKMSERQTFNNELRMLREKISTMYQALVEAEVSRNKTVCEANKKLKMCYARSENLLGDNSLLQKEMKNLSLRTNLLKREKNRIAWVLKKYRNQHVCLGGEKWYMSESTNSLFLLSDDRATFEGAQEKCQEMNASLAIFRSNSELGYITNLIRASQSSRYYWIGLKKSADGLMTWRDGSAFKKFKNKISTLAEGRQRSTFCAEVGGSERWELVPCNRLRQFICQKERTLTETTNKK